MEQKNSMIGRYNNGNSAAASSAFMPSNKQKARTGLSNNSGSPQKRAQFAPPAPTTAQNFRTVLDTASNQQSQNMMASSASKSSSCYTPFKTSTSGFKSKQRLQSSAGTAHHHFDSSSIDSPVKIMNTHGHNSNKSAVKKKVLPPRVIEVETLFIGGGPATLGVLANAYQTQRLDDLILGSSQQNPQVSQGARPQAKGIGNSSSNDYNNKMNSNLNGGMGSLNSLNMGLNCQVSATIKTASGSTVHDVGYHLSTGLVKTGTQLGAASQTFSNDQQQSKSGIAIIDISDQFGGGNLQRHFGIKSNTSASGFLKVLMYSKPYTTPVPAQNQPMGQQGINKNKSNQSQPPCGRTSTFNMVASGITGSTHSGARKISSQGHRPLKNNTNSGNLVQVLGGQVVNTSSDQHPVGSPLLNNNVSHFHALTKNGGVTHQSSSNQGILLSQKSQNRLKNNTNSSQLGQTSNKIGVKQQASKSISNPLHAYPPQSLMANTVGPSIFKGFKGQPSLQNPTGSTKDKEPPNGTNASQRSKSEYDKQQELAKQFMPPFVDFASTNDIALSLQRYGKKVAPLQLIGTFLSYAGNAMLNDIWQRYQKKVFFGNSQAVKIYQVQETIAGNSSTYSWMTEVQNMSTAGQSVVQQTFFKSKNIIFACGAEQMLPQIASLRCKYNLKPSCRIFTSDQVLKQEGFQQLVHAIRQFSGKAKIKILGGSHSAFSVLYLLLNGPCKIKVFEDYKRANQVKGQLHGKSPQKKGSVMEKSTSHGLSQLEARSSGANTSKFSPTKGHYTKSSGKIKDMLNESQKQLYSAGKTSNQSHTQPTHLGPRGYQMNFCYNCYCCNMGQSHSKMKVCPCGAPCKCLSNPQIPPSPRHISSKSATPGKKQSLGSSAEKQTTGCVDPKQQVLQGEDHVSIVYRNQIKVHFSTVEYANQENYTSYDKKLDLSQGGIVYPFTGIRGDAKEIWLRVTKGQEARASFERADSIDEQKQVLTDADIVIFACGYQSNQVPIFDCHGNQIHLASNLFMSQNAMNLARQQHQLRQQQSTSSKQMQNQSNSQQTTAGVKQIGTAGPIGQTLLVNKIVKPLQVAIPQDSSQPMVNNSMGASRKNEMHREYVDVNHNCQLMDARRNNIPLQGLFGIGQGYSLPTSDNSVQAELRPGGKADSVGLYIKQIGNKILSQLFPAKKIVYLMPPKVIPVAGIQLQSYNAPVQNVLASNSLGSRVNGQDNQQVQPKQEQSQVQTVLNQFSKQPNAIEQQVCSQQTILAINMPTSGSLNQQLSLNNTVTVGNFESKSRTTSSKLYCHPKTQEHHSSKFQSFQSSDKGVAFVPQPINQSGPSNHITQNQYMQFSSVFSKSVGKSSLNVAQVAQKSYNGNAYSGGLQNSGVQPQGPLTTSNAINTMTKKYADGSHYNLQTTFDASKNNNMSKSYINRDALLNHNDQIINSDGTATNQHHRWPVVSSRQSKSNQAGFMSITDYLGSRKMVSGPLNSQNQSVSNPKYQYQAHHSAHNQHLALSDNQENNHRNEVFPQQIAENHILDERAILKNQQMHLYPASDPQNFKIHHQNQSDDRSQLLSAKHRQNIGNGILLNPVIKGDQSSIKNNSLSYPQRQDPSLESIDVNQPTSANNNSSFWIRDNKNSIGNVSKKLSSQMALCEQVMLPMSYQDMTPDQNRQKKEAIHSKIVNQHHGQAQANETDAQLINEKLGLSQVSIDDSKRSNNAASPGGFHKKKSPIMSASYVNQQSPINSPLKQTQASIEMLQGARTMIIIQDQQLPSNRLRHDYQKSVVKSNEQLDQVIQQQAHKNHLIDANEYSSSFYKQNLAQKMALSANVSFDKQMIMDQKLEFDEKHQSTANGMLPPTRNETVQQTSISQNQFTDGGITQQLPLQKYQHDSVLHSSWRQRQVMNAENCTDISEKYFMQPGSFSGAHSFLHHPISAADHPANQSMSSYLSKTTNINTNHGQKGEALHAQQIPQTSVIGQLINDTGGMNSMAVDSESPQRNRKLSVAEQQQILHDSQISVTQRERRFSPTLMHFNHQQKPRQEYVLPPQMEQNTLSSVESPSNNKLSNQVAHSNQSKIGGQLHASYKPQSPEPNLITNPISIDQKSRYENSGTGRKSPSKHRNMASMQIADFNQQNRGQNSEFYTGANKGYVSQAVQDKHVSIGDHDLVEQASIHRVTKSNNFHGRSVATHKHVNDKPVQIYNLNSQGTSDLLTQKIEKPLISSGVQSSIPSQVLQNKQLKLQVYPPAKNSASDNGTQKNRVGLSGAAGSIMAANIANMGFVYPNQTVSTIGPTIQSAHTGKAPTSELVPINTGYVSDLQKINGAQNINTNLSKESGGSFLPLKQNKITTSDPLTKMMAAPVTNPMSDNYRQSPQLNSNHSFKQQSLKHPKRQHQRQFQNTAEPLILNNTSISRGSRRVALISAHPPSSSNSHYLQYSQVGPSHLVNGHKQLSGHQQQPTISRSSHTNEYSVIKRQATNGVHSSKPVSSCISAKTTQPMHQGNTGQGCGLLGSSQVAYHQSSSQVGLKKNQSHVYVKNTPAKAQQVKMLDQEQQKLQNRALGYQLPGHTVMHLENASPKKQNIKGPVFATKQSIAS